MSTLDLDLDQPYVAPGLAGEPHLHPVATWRHASEGWPADRHAIELAHFGELTAVSRLGGQGRVYRPTHVPQLLAPGPVVVKLYRRPPAAAQARILGAMAAWGWSMDAEERARLQHVAAWPLAVVSDHATPVGIAMCDVSARFAVPFQMPSGRSEPVLLALEHMLGGDGYLRMRGLPVDLDTDMRARVAERVCAALAELHRYGIVASDIAPSNLLIAFHPAGPTACFIDCDSMVFRGRQALPAVQTADWDMPREWQEPPHTRASDAYKLGLVMLRLFARSHSARDLREHATHVPAPLRELLARSLAPEPLNRPPAGEWQRALAHVLVQRGLAERYPGPVPAPAPRIAVAPPPRSLARPPAPARGQIAALAQVPGGMWAPPSPAPAPPPRVRRVLHRRRAQTAWSLAWWTVMLVLLVLLFSRLLAAALPDLTGSRGGAGGGAGVSFASPYDQRQQALGNGGSGGAPGGYYYAPPGSGPASGAPNQ